jgi:hypothetical protein
MLRTATSVTLICIKASRYSACCLVTPTPSSTSVQSFKQFRGYMQRNVTATRNVGDRLIKAKDMQEAVKIQSDVFQDQVRSLTEHATSMGESATKAATGVFAAKR